MPAGRGCSLPVDSCHELFLGPEASNRHGRTESDVGGGGGLSIPSAVDGDVDG